MPESLKADLEIIIVDTMDDVIKHALTRQPTPLDLSFAGQTSEQFNGTSFGPDYSYNMNHPTNITFRMEL